MKEFGFVLASKMLVDNKRKVRFMYHEKVDNSQDSGWRFFCGDEDDQYINDPNNIGIYDVNTIIDIDNDILPFLKDKEIVAYERENCDDSFVISKEFFDNNKECDSL